jgi:hypothetical protein
VPSLGSAPGYPWFKAAVFATIEMNVLEAAQRADVEAGPG